MKAIRMSKYLMPLLVVGALLGSVYGAKALGAWQTSGRGQILLDESGAADPEGIKGWMTLTEISEIYGLPLADLYVMLGATFDLQPDTELKELEELLPGTEVWAVREAVAAYLNGSWSPADGPYAAEIEGHEPQEAFLETGASPTPTPLPQPAPQSDAEHIPLGEGQGAGVGDGSGFQLPVGGSRLPASEIWGRMTVQEVVEHCQIPLEILVAELGLPANVDTQLRMRDLAAQMAVEVQTVRDVVASFQAEN